MHNLVSHPNSTGSIAYLDFQSTLSCNSTAYL
uniref:Uncharacterized protein n=1 Tax=Arundo donax TaxID=35708 RepID=A0A0A9H450_ARUDO